MPDETAEELEQLGKLQLPRSVTLGYPIDFGRTRIDVLDFKRGNVGAIKGMKVDGVPNADQCLLIASRLCGQPVAALEMLDADDAAEVIAIAMGFFARCLGAGKPR